MSWISEVIRSMSRPLQWWVVVAVWEQAVLVRWGKRTRHLMPGVHLRIPFVDRVIRMCVRLRSSQPDPRTVSTKDGKPLTIGLSIEYEIKDARKMTESVARPETTLGTRCQSLVAQVVSSRNSDELSPEVIEKALVEKMDFVDAWGLENVQVYVVTFVYARVIRILQAQEHGTYSALDTKLDEKPATVN